MTASSPTPGEVEPRLSVVAPGAGEATHTVVIVLPGGRSRDRTRARPTRLANLRMLPIARAARRGAGDGVAVWRLLYRYRGWNEPFLDPVQDCRWAMDEARRQFPRASVVLVGHSMGGRTALYAAGHPSVVAVCALAPWIERGDPVATVAGRALLLVHGDRDRITEPAATRWYAEQAQGVAASVRLVRLADGHGMLRRWSTWHGLVQDFVSGVGAASHDRRP